MQSILIDGPWNLMNWTETCDMGGLEILLLPADIGPVAYVVFVVPGGIFHDPDDGRGTHFLLSRIITNNGYRLAQEKNWGFAANFLPNGTIYTFTVLCEAVWDPVTWQTFRMFLRPSDEILERLLLLERSWLQKEWRGADDYQVNQSVSRGIFSGSSLATYPFDCLYHGDDLDGLTVGMVREVLQREFSPGNLELILLGGELSDALVGVLEQADFLLGIENVFPRVLGAVRGIHPRGNPATRQWRSTSAGSCFFGVNENPSGDPLRGGIATSMVTAFLREGLADSGDIIHGQRICRGISALQIATARRVTRRREDELQWFIGRIPSRRNLTMFRDQLASTWISGGRNIDWVLSKIGADFLSFGRVIGFEERMAALDGLSLADVAMVTAQLDKRNCVRV